MIESSKVPAGVMKVTSAGMPSTINRRRPSRARMSFCAHLRPPTSVFTPHRFHYRAVITLYDVYGWSMTEVAACLTPSTAKRVRIERVCFCASVSENSCPGAPSSVEAAS